MTIQCSVFIACSLDGYIARIDGSIDWLTEQAGSEDYGYNEFMRSVDAVVLGRKTYALARTFPAWPYGGRRVYVLSSAYPAEGEALSPSITGTSLGPGNLRRLLSDGGFRRAYVDGGRTIQSFLAAGAIDDMTITRVPLLLGEGMPLFGMLGTAVRLRHDRTESFRNGFVQSRYEVLRGG